MLLSSKNLKGTTGVAKKLLPKWIGPFTVTDKADSTVAVQLELPVDWQIYDVFHVSRAYESAGTVGALSP